VNYYPGKEARLIEMINPITGCYGRIFLDVYPGASQALFKFSDSWLRAEGGNR